MKTKKQLVKNTGDEAALNAAMSVMADTLSDELDALLNRHAKAGMRLEPIVSTLGIHFRAALSHFAPDQETADKLYEAFRPQIKG